MSNSRQVNVAAKWSFVTEIAYKIVSPIVNMILARLLTPEDFGIVATVVMITSFADIFSNAGFSKYLVQQQYKLEKEQADAANVAFATNMAISIAFWLIIIVFRDSLSILVGNPGYGHVIAVGGCILPLTALSSVQIAVFQRNMEYRKLFYGKLIGILMPLLITVPLAFFTHSFWAMIIGNICVNLANAAVLTINSSWRPNTYFNLNLLKKMFGFGSWAFLEQLLGWFNLNIGLFIVSNILSQYYLGLYKTSMAIVNQLMAVFTTTLSAIVITTLSKYARDREGFLEQYYHFQRMLSIIIIPIGIGFLVYRRTITLILLGSNWLDVADFVGMWGFATAIEYAFASFSVECFTAIGKPRYGAMMQLLFCILSVPVLYFCALKGFVILCIARAGFRIVTTIIEMIIMRMAVNYSFLEAVKNLGSILMASVVMGVFGITMHYFFSETIIDVVCIIGCMIIYTFIVTRFPKNKELILDFISDLRRE